MAPKDVHSLILGTCEYVILYSKQNFANVIKVVDLKMRRLFLDYLDKTILIT